MRSSRYLPGPGDRGTSAKAMEPEGLYSGFEICPAFTLEHLPKLYRADVGLLDGTCLPRVVPAAGVAESSARAEEGRALGVEGLGEASPTRVSRVGGLGESPSPRPTPIAQFRAKCAGYVR